MMAARVHELTGVVAVLSAHDDYDIALTCQVDGRALALLGRVTHGIDEANVRLRESLSDQRDEVTHPIDWLCGLGSNAETRMFLELQHIMLVQHDVECLKIFSEAPHLHVVALANDDRMIALANEGSDGLVRHMDEGACPFNGLQTQRANLG
jgi:hypothetical protein